MSEVIVNLTQAGITSSKLAIGDYQIIIDRPVSKGGNGEGPMGGQVLLMSVAGCFASTLYAAAQARDLEITDLKINVIGHLSAKLPVRFEALTLEVKDGGCGDDEAFKRLLKIAEKGCIAVNTIKSGMSFKVSSNMSK